MNKMITQARTVRNRADEQVEDLKAELDRLRDIAKRVDVHLEMKDPEMARKVLSEIL